jgi:hypothetical protein
MLLFFLLIIILFAGLLGYISTTGVKSQWIRIIDILVIGPLMIYIGIKYYNTLDKQHQQKQNVFNIDKYLCYIIIFFGATTITYNLKNYLHIYFTPLHI